MPIIKRPWRTQPQYVAPVAWGDPITRGLEFLAPLRPGDGGIDLVGGQRATRTGALNPAAARNGVYHTFGTGSYLDFPRLPANVGGTTPATIAWTQEPRATSGNSAVINIKPTGAAYTFAVYLSASAGNYQFSCGPRLSASATTFSSTVGVVTNNVLDRYLLVAAGGLNSTTPADYVLFRNGARLTSSSSVTFGTNTTASFRVGALETASDPFEGLLGNLHIWSRALADSEGYRWTAEGGEFSTLAPRRIWVPVSVAGGAITGDLSAAEAGSDAAAMDGAVLVAGDLAATEPGSDAAALAGAVLVAGTMAATETAADAASLAGAVLVSGTLAAAETGPDTASIAGAGAEAPITGTLAAAETGSDTAAVTGAVLVAGLLAALESGSDGAALAGQIRITGALAAAETGSDTAALGNVSQQPYETWLVPAEARVYAVSESRAYPVPAERRTYTTPK